MRAIIQKYIVNPKLEDQKKSLFGKKQRISVCADISNVVVAVEQFLMKHVDCHTQMQVKVQ